MRECNHPSNHREQEEDAREFQLLGFTAPETTVPVPNSTSVKLNTNHSEQPPMGVHMDNYYLFIFIDTGWLRVDVDFQEGELGAHTCGFLEPGKVHQHKEFSPDVHGYIMGVESTLLNVTISECMILVDSMQS